MKKFLFLLLVLLLVMPAMAAPIASFTTNVSPDNNKPNLAVAFTDTSTNSPVTWQWSFQDYGNATLIRTYFSTLKNPTQLFGAGNFSISLTTTNSSGYAITSKQITWINISAGKVRPDISLSGYQEWPADHIFNTPINTLPVDPRSAVWTGNMSGGIKNPYLAIAKDLPLEIVDNNITTSKLLKLDLPIVSNGTYFQIPDYMGVQNAGYMDHASYIINPDAKTATSFYQNHLPRFPNGTYEEEIATNYDESDYVINLGPANFARVDPPPMRYDEIVNGNITHVVGAAIYRQQHTYIWPGNQNNGQFSNTSYPPCGARFRLNASFDTSGYSRNATVILNALKTYGFIVTDNNADPKYFDIVVDRQIRSMFDINYTTFARIHATDFEAVDESSLMINTHSGKALKPPASLQIAGSCDFLSPDCWWTELQRIWAQILKQ
jgi:PKD repeat protein